MNEYLSRLICLQNGSLSIIDRENRTLNECFLTTYLQVPSYLAFTVLNAFALGSSSQMPRLIRHRTLTILRLISTLILLISISEIFLKYFTSLYPEWDPNEPLFCTQLVVEFYKLAAFSLNVFVLFNRNVFRRVFPLTLLVSLFALVFVNLTFYGNRIYASTKTFDEMALFERIEILKMTFYNSLLLMYLLTVLLGFGVESLRVIDLDIPPEALYNQQPEEDEASYFSYLSFRWLQRLMKKGFRREIASIDDLCQLPRNLDINRVFTVFLSRFVKTKHNEYLNSPIIEPNLLLNNEYIEKFSIRYEDEVIRQRSLMNQCFQIQNGLIRTMWKSFGGKFMVLGVIKFLNDCLSFAGPLLLNQLVQFIEFNDTSLKNGLTYATALFLSTLACALLNVHFTHSLNKLCLRVRISLISLVYRKCAIAKLNELGKLSLGEILNYMSIDCDSIVNMLPSFHSLWSLPFQIVITLYLLYDQIGISFLVGVGFVIVLIPINKFISDFIGKVQTKLMTYKDERVNIMTEFLDGIRVIKFYSWEKYFLTRIDQVREKELGRLRAKKYLDAGCVYFWATTPILMSVFTFITYVYIGNKLTPSKLKRVRSLKKVFTSLALFNMLIGPLNSFPWVINGLVQAYVSIKRVQRYLNLGNLNWLEYYSFNELENSSSQPETIIELRNATFSWKSNAQRDGTEEADQSLLEAAELPVLRDLNISVKRGQFIGVIGKVGAGKSSLLHAILAEIEKLNDSSRVRIDAKICAEGFAYVSQECWIQGSSIRENILFGSPYDPDLYARVVYACALEADLAQLPHGDATPVGENGICLSGGQKARLTLARACYTRSQKSLFLLDDPLSAVDSHVAQHIFAHCITGLLGDKTRVLCTHHVKFLVDADLVIVLDSSGVVRESGRGRDIVPPYLERDQVHGITVGLSKRKQIELDEGESSTAPAPSQVISEDVIKKFNEQEEIKRDEEEKEHGVISSSIYMFYSKSIGLVLCFLTILFLALMQASKNLTDFWLSYWTQHHGSSNSSLSKSPSSSRTTSSTTYILNPSAQTHFYTPHGFINSAEAPDDDTKYFFIVYLSLCGANTLFTFVRAFLFAYSGITAGKRIHNKLIQSLSHATLKFFDMTPRGRIINRLSSDMYTIDDSLPFILNIFLACIFGLIGILVVTCYSLPWFALILIPLFIIYYTIQNYYRWTSRELKRLSSLALSPVYNHFNETLKGLITIRAFRQVSNFLGQHESYVENYIRASYSSMSAGQWLNFRLHALSVVMIAFVGFVAVFQHIYSSSAVNASLIGLALSYVLNVTGYLNGLIGSFTETEKELVSVERAHQFADLPQENWSGRIENVEMNWPRRPEIEFSEVKLSYTGNLDSCALNGVSFKINAGEKIGICGRTGSGKSSLLMALFRAVELSEGSILIDGLNIRDLNLKDLRERLSIIPQEPFLFRSTLRANLDPSGTKSDHELWSALRDVHLDLKFRAIESSGIGLNGGGLSCGLDWSVDDKGKNLSAGERQLVCLARAILANRSIICIDEATASVDYETDAFIQTTIRDKFKSVTVLTVAHRINTIFDYDRILVMSDGRVAEFDTVANLLENKNSIFSRLCDESNKTKK